ncbi:MAG TPA: cbb3-type cytochrome oxidase assembly protein CcoS, partial [Sediminibacterium sp.]|nr:cbb3-type cytochrome oxidase assembly protein CcoS [Sediminibacterium sp.]
ASISVAGLFLAAFIWSVRNGQYDDETAPALRILFEEKSPDNSITTGKTPEQSHPVATTKANLK